MMIDLCDGRTLFGGSLDGVNPEGGKPKGMHWRTYQRLKGKLNHDG